MEILLIYKPQAPGPAFQIWWLSESPPIGCRYEEYIKRPKTAISCFFNLTSPLLFHFLYLLLPFLDMTDRGRGKNEIGLNVLTVAADTTMRSTQLSASPLLRRNGRLGWGAESLRLLNGVTTEEMYTPRLRLKKRMPQISRAQASSRCARASGGLWSGLGSLNPPPPAGLPCSH